MKRKHLIRPTVRCARVRVLVDDIEQCYAALSIVHELWTPIQKEFDDYIARPKPNGYRSLHTAVIGPRGLSVEVQIRTQQMHHDSELGVAAHWRYKENKNPRAAWMTRSPGCARFWRGKTSCPTRRTAATIQERTAAGPRVCADAAGKSDRPAHGRDAGGFRLRGAHRPRSSHARAKLDGSIVPLNTNCKPGSA